MQNNPPPRLSAHDMRRLAVEAVIDPRTIARYMAGLAVASTSAARILAAGVKLGLDVRPAVPSTPGARYVEIDLEAVIADSDL